MSAPYAIVRGDEVANIIQADEAFVAQMLPA